MTVGNSARLQLSMAQAQTKYGDQLNSLNASYLAGNKFNKYGIKNTNATKTLDELLKSSKLKGKDENFRSQFSDLYKSIYGISDDSSDDNTTASAQSIKTASASAGNAAESIKSFANSLKYADEVDTDTYKKQAQAFVDSYNAMIDKVGNSDNQGVLQKGVLMVNTGKVYTSALKRAGITVGADNKLSVNSDLSKVKAVNIKSVFGSDGFSDKVIQKAGQINTLTGGNGMFSANAVTSSSSASSKTEYSDNKGTLKELSAKVKDMATEVKSYATGLGTEDKVYTPEDYTKVAKDFIDTYNSFVDEASKSDNSAVRNRATTLTSGAQAYKYSLQRAGINVDKNGKLSLADEAALNKLTDRDIKYSFGGSGFLQKVTDKADQINSLVSSASTMGYNSNKTTNYAYSSGALFAVYA
ncbi:MAG: hypothetical protein K2J80_00935 [Oscillospiraceae bacterium]|nr:hypothetical protein [Oscillospiraceae bacterium]